jgi:hypothetical protein
MKIIVRVFDILPAILLALLMPILSGCSGGRRIPSTEPVSGTVTIKGKPIDGIEVYFCGEGFVAYGKTDAQGNYQLVQGAVPGENKVYFKKLETVNSAIAQQEGMDDYQMQMMAEASSGGKKSNAAAKPTVPPEFADSANPKLSFLVAPGGTDAANFKL